MGDIGAFGFWFFIAAAVVGGIWYDAKEKESKQETLRRVVESGQDIDAALIEKMLGEAQGNRNAARDLRIATLIMIGVSAGMFVFSLFLGVASPEGRAVLMGVSGLVICIAGGLWAAARYLERESAE
ncbi:MAG: hypothetical protein AAF578_08990 [Pseudomonadota bacterium]